MQKAATLVKNGYLWVTCFHQVLLDGEMAAGCCPSDKEVETMLC
jgi:hypothetical protein